MPLPQPVLPVSEDCATGERVFRASCSQAASLFVSSRIALARRRPTGGGVYGFAPFSELSFQAQQVLVGHVDVHLLVIAHRGHAKCHLTGADRDLAVSFRTPAHRSMIISKEKAERKSEARLNLGHQKDARRPSGPCVADDSSGKLRMSLGRNERADRSPLVCLESISVLFVQRRRRWSS